MTIKLIFRLITVIIITVAFVVRINCSSLSQTRQSIDDNRRIVNEMAIDLVVKSDTTIETKVGQSTTEIRHFIPPRPLEIGFKIDYDWSLDNNNKQKITPTTSKTIKTVNLTNKSGRAVKLVYKLNDSGKKTPELVGNGNNNNKEKASDSLIAFDTIETHLGNGQVSAAYYLIRINREFCVLVALVVLVVLVTLAVVVCLIRCFTARSYSYSSNNYIPGKYNCQYD